MKQAGMCELSLKFVKAAPIPVKPKPPDIHMFEMAPAPDLER